MRWPFASTLPASAVKLRTLLDASHPHSYSHTMLYLFILLHPFVISKADLLK